MPPASFWERIEAKMSYWNVPPSDYFEAPAGTPGWQSAPVPGWGINPLRAGPARVGIGGGIWEEDAFLPHWSPLGADPSSGYRETSWGMVGLATSGGILLGVLFGYAWWAGPKKLTANRSKRPRRGPTADRKRAAATMRRWQRLGIA